MHCLVVFHLMRRLFAKQFLLSFVLIALFICSFGQDARDHLAKGDRTFDKKDYEGALKSYLDAIEYHKGFPDSLRENLPSHLHTLLPV